MAEKRQLSQLDFESLQMHGSGKPGVAAPCWAIFDEAAAAQ